MNGELEDADGTCSAPTTATVSSTEAAALSTPARNSAAGPRLSTNAVKKTPTFRPPLRRLSSGTALAKVNAAFKSPLRTDTSQPNVHSTTTSHSESPHNTPTEKGDAGTNPLKANKPSGRRFTGPSRPSPYHRTPTHTRTMHSSREAGSCQRETVEEVARDITQLRQQLENVENEIAELSEDYCEDELQQYIDHLHQYNEMKDVGQLLLGKLAEVQGTTVSELYKQFDLNLDD